MSRHTAMLVAAMLIGSGCAAQQLPVASDNLIENGSFEASPVGEVPRGDVPEGWEYEAYGASGQLEIIPGGAPGCGEKCLKVTTGVSDRRSGLHGPMLPIDPTKAYRQSGWMRIDGKHVGGGGLYLGRAWFDADSNPVGSRPGVESNYTYVAGAVSPQEWTYYEQLLLPDGTPEDGTYRPDELPAQARFLRIWALSFEWEGVGYFDGLALEEIDYAAVARDQISDRLEAEAIPEVRADTEHALESLPEDSKVAQRATKLLGDLDALHRRLQAAEQRSISEWVADREAAAGLIRALQRMKWEVKIEALLLAADAPAGGQ